MQLTYFYGDESGRLAAARDLYERYCRFLFDDPARAKTQMMAGIQSALAQAFAQGCIEGAPDRRQAEQCKYGYDVGAGLVREGDDAMHDGQRCRVLTVYPNGELWIEIPSYKTVKWRFVTPLPARHSEFPA